MLQHHIFVVSQQVFPYPKIITVAPLLWFEQLLFRHVQGKRERHSVDLNQERERERDRTNQLTAGCGRIVQCTQKLPENVNPQNVHEEFTQLNCKLGR